MISKVSVRGTNENWNLDFPTFSPLFEVINVSENTLWFGVTGSRLVGGGWKQLRWFVDQNWGRSEDTMVEGQSDPVPGDGDQDLDLDWCLCYTTTTTITMDHHHSYTTTITITMDHHHNTQLQESNIPTSNKLKKCHWTRFCQPSPGWGCLYV